MWRPSGDQAAALTESVCVSVSLGFGVSSLVVASQMRVVPSMDAVRMCVPSGDHATEVSRSLSACVSVSVSVSVFSPVVVSQMRAVPSRDAVRMCVPSGDHATEVTLLE